uniref:Retrotransposon protein n=1 Tax=Heterorhabditis bacteriophora TaxID=37862 RepID=A0A1I7XVL2_HETBA
MISLRKCNLSNIIQPQEVDGKMAEINYFFTGDMTTVVTGLPFHAFLKLLFYIAEKKFKTEDNLLSKMQRLLAFCDMSLRYYGVRSARLRRTEVDTNQEENPVEIYMLPNRMRGKRRSRSTEPAKVAIRRSKADRNNNTDTLSLPKIV